MPTEHRRRPRRSPRAAIAAVAALGVLGGGAALAAQYTTHTGIFGQPGKTENDTSEYIDPNAPDFVAYARQLTADIQFAPGDSADHYWWYFEVKNADGRASLTQVTGIKGTIANAASCSWQRAWLAAYEAHDVAGMKQASNEIHQAARSSALAAVNQAAYTEHLVDAADRGDPTALRTSLRMACPAPKAEATR